MSMLLPRRVPGSGMLLATDSISCVACADWMSIALRISDTDTASPV